MTILLHPQIFTSAKRPIHTKLLDCRSRMTDKYAFTAAARFIRPATEPVTAALKRSGHSIHEECDAIQNQPEFPSDPDSPPDCRATRRFCPVIAQRGSKTGFAGGYGCGPCAV